MSKKEVQYIIKTIDGHSYTITVDQAEELIYDSYNFTHPIDTSNGERINPSCIISIRKYN